ncbi:MAG: RAMP superfamily CRISPR-associated protein [Hominimerdicola sp.]
MFNNVATNKSNYKFIPIKTPAKFYTVSESEKTNCGYIDIICHAVTDLHIGSGSFGIVDGKFAKLTEKVNGRFVIPGSSMKGCVRNIARIVSDGCVKLNAKDDLQHKADRNINCKPDKHCIVCDIFGLLGQKSRVFFDDLIAPAATKSKTFTVQEGHSPHKCEGFKLYPTVPDNDIEPVRNLMIEAVPSCAVFSGRVYFERLSQDELELLLFALGLDESFDLKIGGFKYDKLGECYIVCDKLVINGKEHKNAKQIAENYANNYGKKFSENINELRNILEP